MAGKESTDELRKIADVLREMLRHESTTGKTAEGIVKKLGGDEGSQDAALVAGAVASAVGTALGPLISSLQESLKESHAALLSLATGGGMERAFSGDLTAAAGSGFQRHQAVAGDVSEIARRAAAAGVAVTDEQAEEWAERSAQTRRLEQQNMRAARQASGFAPGGLLEWFDDAVDFIQGAAYRLTGRDRQARESEMNASTEGRR